MEILIFTEANATTGLGHLSRCTALDDAFKEKNIDPLFIINGDEELLKQFISGRNFQTINWLNENQEIKRLLQKADVIIIDSYLATEENYRILSEEVPSAIFFDDNQRINYPAGIILNGAIFAEKIPYPENQYEHLLGSQYIPLRSDFWDLKPKPINSELKKIMLTTGGTDLGNVIPQVLTYLQASFPDLHIMVIIGKSFDNLERIQKVAKPQQSTLIMYPDAGIIKKVMYEADLAISSCGQTLYELAAMGVPTLAFTTAPNQLNNARGWKKTGFIRFLGNYYEKAELKILTPTIESLKNKVTREQMVRTGQKFVDGQGARRIVKYLLEKINATDKNH